MVSATIRLPARCWKGISDDKAGQMCFLILLPAAGCCTARPRRGGWAGRGVARPCAGTGSSIEQTCRLQRINGMKETFSRIIES